MDAPLGRILGMLATTGGLLALAQALDRGWFKNQSNQAPALQIAIRSSHESLSPLADEHGFDQDLFEAFASDLGYRTKFVTTHSTQESLELVKKGAADVALGVYTHPATPTAQQSIVYSQIQPLIACRAGVDLKKLYQKKTLSILLPEDENLRDAGRIVKNLYPEALFLNQKNLSVGSALALMHDKKIDCTLTQERLFKMFKLAYPRMKSAMLVGGSVPMAAHFSGGSWPLKTEFEVWLKTKVAKIKIDALKEQHFGFFEIFDAYEVEIFEKRIESRLRRYIPFFKEAERKHGIAWQTLAAIAYQESQWDPAARSFTGVKGLMMLTQNTAKEMGISNRVDPQKSILGGAAYLAKLMKNLPKKMSEHEKLFFALASYNVGYGHVKDAQTLVASADESQSWHALKKSLPLLAKPQFYIKLRHGKARGKEPVLYVQRIRKFSRLLSLAFSSEETLRSDSSWADNTKANTSNTLMN